MTASPPPTGTIGGVGLATYQSCSFAEKRAVLRAFWSTRVDDSEKVNQAAREYGPYALVMVAVIAVELVAISVALLVAGSDWLWLGVVASLLALWSLRWTRTCQLRARSFPPGS